MVARASISARTRRVLALPRGGRLKSGEERQRGLAGKTVPGKLPSRVARYHAMAALKGREKREDAGSRPRTRRIEIEKKRRFLSMDDPIIYAHESHYEHVRSVVPTS